MKKKEFGWALGRHLAQTEFGRETKGGIHAGRGVWRWNHWALGIFVWGKAQPVWTIFSKGFIVSSQNLGLRIYRLRAALVFFSVLLAFSSSTDASLWLIIFSHYPQREWGSQLLILSSGSPGFILPSRRILQEYCIFMHHGIHMCIIQRNLIYFENIITQYISDIMTLHTTNSLPFRERYNQILTSCL